MILCPQFLGLVIIRKAHRYRAKIHLYQKHHKLLFQEPLFHRYLPMNVLLYYCQGVQKHLLLITSPRPPMIEHTSGRGIIVQVYCLRYNGICGYHRTNRNRLFHYSTTIMLLYFLILLLLDVI